MKLLLFDHSCDLWYGVSGGVGQGSEDGESGQRSSQMWFPAVDLLSYSYYCMVMLFNLVEIMNSQANVLKYIYNFISMGMSISMRKDKEAKLGRGYDNIKG